MKFDNVTIKDIAKGLADERGLGVDDLRGILKDARSKAISVPEAPGNVSAVTYRKIRTNLYRQIPFDDETFNLVNDSNIRVRSEG